MLNIMKASAASTRHPGRAGGGWRPLSAFLALVLLFACPIMMRAPAFAQDSEPKRIETKFEQGDESYPAFILLDRVAIVLTEEGQTNENYIRIVRQLGGKRIEGLSRNIIGIDVPDASKAADLKAFNRVVLAERTAGLQEFIADAGVLVTVAGSERPRVMTDRIVVRIDADRDPDFIQVILDEFNAELVRRDPFDERSFVIRMLAEIENTLEVSNAINSRSGVSFAHPSFYIEGEWRASVTPTDEFFAHQWHLLNTGQGNGTEDADIDADLAWFLGAGSSDVLIAVIDSGFEIDHPDLADALWTNPHEIPDNEVDDDGDGYIDNVHGWDFSSCPGHHPKSDPDHCGDNDVNPTEFPKNTHGTGVAGAALARAFNGIQPNGRHEGVVGVCPHCQLLPLRFSINQPVETHPLPIRYAQSTGAKIINISWGYLPGEVVPLNVSQALEDAAAAGVAIFVSMTNQSNENCAAEVPDISANPYVIAVAGSTNEDLVSPGGFGRCLSVLAPTDGGTLRMTTTDLIEYHGYNYAQRKPAWNCRGPQNNHGYTHCFGGLSFSAALASGVAGLVLSHDDRLQWEDVKRLLQDTADKVSDSVAQYSVDTGYSAPASGESPRHGYGRLNAFEAVRVVADAFGGRGGVDIFVRDNRLDWGNTEQPSSVTFEKSRGVIPYWESVDIKIDAPPFRTVPPANPDELSCLGSAGLQVETMGGGRSIQAPQTSVDFGCFAHEDPVPGVLNKIYVRAHNRGVSAAKNVRVKLIWAVHSNADAPELAADFWTAFASNADSGDTSKWHPLPTQTVASLPYSGASLAGTGDDASAVLSFDFTAPVFDQTDHLTVLAIIDSPDDPVSPDTMASQAPSFITPHDNNVTQLTMPLGAADSPEPIAAVQAPQRRSHVGNAAYRRAWWYYSRSMATGNQARATLHQEHTRRWRD
jgi:subtilisin family serine protease